MKEKKEDHGKELLPPILLLLFTYVCKYINVHTYFYKTQRATRLHAPFKPTFPAGFSNKHVLYIQYNTYGIDLKYTTHDQSSFLSESTSQQDRLVPVGQSGVCKCW